MGKDVSALFDTWRPVVLTAYPKYYKRFGSQLGLYQHVHLRETPSINYEALQLLPRVVFVKVI